MPKFEYIDYFFYIVSASCESCQIYCRILSNWELMNHKALAIVPIVAVILFVETAKGDLLLLTLMLANAKIGTNDILNGAKSRFQKEKR
jgi:ABC-type transport system involved in cytochrome c biogenesis permease component